MMMKHTTMALRCYDDDSVCDINQLFQIQISAMAEKAVSELADSGKELLDKLSDIEVFRREEQGTVAR